MKLIQGCPPALPGSCYKCGSATREKYVDLETDVEFHGAMYLCNECIVEMGTLIGMLDNKEALKFKLNTETMEIEKERLREELRALKDVKNAIDRVTSLERIDDSTGDGSSSDSDFGATVTESAEGESVGEDGTPEPSNDEGVDELRSGSDYDRQSEFTF